MGKEQGRGLRENVEEGLKEGVEDTVRGFFKHVTTCQLMTLCLQLCKQHSVNTGVTVTTRCSKTRSKDDMIYTRQHSSVNTELILSRNYKVKGRCLPQAIFHFETNNCWNLKD